MKFSITQTFHDENENQNQTSPTKSVHSRSVVVKLKNEKCLHMLAATSNFRQIKQSKICLNLDLVQSEMQFEG